MKIYDYYDDNSFGTVFFVLVTVICLSAFVFLITKCLKIIKMKHFDVGFVLLSLSIVIILILITITSSYTFSLIRFDFNCKQQRYESVTGTLEVIEIEQNDYRDSKQYDISFNVDNVFFENKIISFSEEQKKCFDAYESKCVTVNYSYIGNYVVIYQIFS